ncbi:Sialic acid-specific 9-O-acetylesterase [Arcticibacter svalbardensis MN12-7]|uniref:Sialic acid-specific 9-O-acetylesterase n=2 Tax=Arcticibacter TaxID=1288026 RepID=R9GSC0_9SPHI|nr:Sialic acid-specific 9-O-acetylesterase [Arcticibacter svalbardensis MN12-7]
MVLQRQQKVPVWGTAQANAIVNVLFAGQSKSVKVNLDGNWRIDLDALRASAEPQMMTITSKWDNKMKEIKIKDVLVGEVWLCSGQSNMYRPFRMLMGEATDPAYEPAVAYLRNEAATANDPLFRQFKVGNSFSVLEEQTNGRGEWSKAIPVEVNEFSGTAYFFGKELRQKLNVPVAIISCNLGATRIEPWMPINAYEKNSSLKAYYDGEIAAYKENLSNWDEQKANTAYKQLLVEWEEKVKSAETKGEKAPDKPRKIESPARDKQVPGTLYNAMVHPLVPFAVKGAIWYQGESNTDNSANDYGLRLAALVEGWRAAWGQKQFFFFCSQLANYRSPNKEPVGDEDGWATISYQQSQILKLNNTGLAVLNDIGEASDIHPKNKMEVGKRLSLWALHQAYGQNIVYSGPLYKNAEVKGSKMVIHFDNAGSGLMVGKKQLLNPTVEVNEPLKRFQICGADQQWKWAEARIIDKNKVEVWHPRISQPIEVRYAWSSNPEGANLYNKEGLPASLFKTNNN